MLKLGYRYPNSQVLRSLALILSILINQIRTNATLSLYTASPFLVLLLADRSQTVWRYPCSVRSVNYNADRGVTFSLYDVGGEADPQIKENPNNPIDMDGYYPVRRVTI